LKSLAHASLIAALALSIACAPNVSSSPEGTEVVTAASGWPKGLLAVLSETPLSVAASEGVALELWLPRELSLSDEADDMLGIAFNRLREGELLGVIDLSSEWIDYRGSRVAAGAYGLRYLRQPADGAHLGTATYRDFALLVPIDGLGNTASERAARAETLAASRKITGTTHPAVLALFPVYEEVDHGAVIENEMGQTTLAAIVADGLTIGFVVDGQAEAEGY
jgi:hypothetical protein